jgi:hypothetical protein
VRAPAVHSAVTPRQGRDEEISWPHCSYTDRDKEACMTVGEGGDVGHWWVSRCGVR